MFQEPVQFLESLVVLPEPELRLHCVSGEFRIIRLRPACGGKQWQCLFELVAAKQQSAQSLGGFRIFRFQLQSGPVVPDGEFGILLRFRFFAGGDQFRRSADSDRLHRGFRLRERRGSRGWTGGEFRPQLPHCFGELSQLLLPDGKLFPRLS